MLWAIIAFLVALWIAGLVLEIAGGFVHVLLVIAAIVLVFQLVSGRRAV